MLEVLSPKFIVGALSLAIVAPTAQEDTTTTEEVEAEVAPL